MMFSEGAIGMSNSMGPPKKIPDRDLTKLRSESTKGSSHVVKQKNAPETRFKPPTEAQLVFEPLSEVMEPLEKHTGIDFLPQLIASGFQNPPPTRLEPGEKYNPKIESLATVPDLKDFFRDAPARTAFRFHAKKYFEHYKGKPDLVFIADKEQGSTVLKVFAYPKDANVAKIGIGQKEVQHLPLLGAYLIKPTDKPGDEPQVATLLRPDAAIKISVVNRNQKMDTTQQYKYTEKFKRLFVEDFREQLNKDRIMQLPHDYERMFGSEFAQMGRFLTGDTPEAKNVRSLLDNGLKMVRQITGVPLGSVVDNPEDLNRLLDQARQSPLMQDLARRLPAPNPNGPPVDFQTAEKEVHEYLASPYARKLVPAEVRTGFPTAIEAAHRSYISSQN
jgi:hypothetical protein